MMFHRLRKLPAKGSFQATGMKTFSYDVSCFFPLLFSLLARLKSKNITDLFLLFEKFEFVDYITGLILNSQQHLECSEIISFRNIKHRKSIWRFKPLKYSVLEEI